MDEEVLSFNGVNGANGRYLSQPSRRELTELILGKGTRGDRVLTPVPGARPSRPRVALREVMPGVRPKDLASAGWGVLFAADTKPAIKEALRPLLAHRKRLAGPRYREYAGTGGLLQGESKPRFLARHGIGPGPVNPRKVPYYLLIVGGPEKIPFDFQHQLGVQYAVGRLAFDTPEEYEQYARNVIEAEGRLGPQARRAAFFGVRNPDDQATFHSSEYLLKPLVEILSEDEPDWQIESRVAADATKAELGRLLGAEDRPTLLFTTSHGMWFTPGHHRQLSNSGALLCQDWPGPKAFEGKVPEDFYFAAHDVGDDMDLRGMMTFHFACFGAGVPEYDSFRHPERGEAERLAPQPFVCRLPQRLLAHPRGALAVIGHVDRAWGFSFYPRGVGSQPDPFEAVLKSLMAGEPVGRAMRFFGDRYGQSAADLEVAIGQSQTDGLSDDTLELWTGTRDARSYAILGDPAVKLNVEKPTPPPGRRRMAPSWKLFGQD